MLIYLLRRLLPVLVVMVLVVPVAAQEINYDVELAKIDRQIVEAEREAAQYSGGLVLVMIKLRIELLRSSRALIEFGRLQETVRGRSGSGVFRQWLSGSRTASSEVKPKSEEIGLLCGEHDFFATPVVLKQNEKLIAYGAVPFEPYTETDDAIIYELKLDDGQKIECSLNRCTLETRCQKTKKPVKEWVQQCRLASSARIPSSSQYWLSCGIPGKPKTDNRFKIVLGSNSSIEGGYLIWKNISDEGVVTEECQINRYNGAVLCSIPKSVAKDASISKRWEVLDDPKCRVLPRRF